MIKISTPEAQANRDSFNNKYKMLGCSCHISPPCDFCTHEGNPSNQAENDDCWIELEDDDKKVNEFDHYLNL